MIVYEVPSGNCSLEREQLIRDLLWRKHNRVLKTKKCFPKSSQAAGPFRFDQKPKNYYEIHSNSPHPRTYPNTSFIV